MNDMMRSLDSDYEAWFLAEIQFAIEDANTNPCIPAEEVEAYFAAKRQASLLRVLHNPSP